MYTWIVNSHDGNDANTFPTWKKTIRADLRLGASGPSPFDNAGPVTVNMANGNANLSFASPTVQTLGGPMGMSFAYNSQEVKDANRGLTGEYFDARNNGVVPTQPADFSFTGKTPLFVRTDPAVSFDWGMNAPMESVPADAFLARWTGFVTVPQQYVGQSMQFGVRQDDGARVWVNGEQVVDNWVHTAPVATWGPSRTYTGSAMPFRFEFYDVVQLAVAEVWVKIGSTEFIVPPDWFTKKVQVLPEGWSASTPIAGASAAWVSASLTDSAVILTDATGKTHTYQRASTGGFTPPAGEFGVVSLDGDGLVVFTDEDGTVYEFSKEGKVESATSAADGQKPAAPFPVLDSRGVTTSVNDPVSKSGSTYTRSVTFTYQDSAQTACPELAGTGYAKAPVDLLCVITYPDASVTNLYYNTVGRLAAIRDPGTELTTFGYNAEGLLAVIRDSVGNDAVTAGLTATPASTTEIGYTTGKVTTVTLPAPDGTTTESRPSKTFTYVDGTSTTVQVTGLTGNASTVTYDTAWRQLTATTAMGVTATQEWHPQKDLVLSTTDNWGRKATTIYDPVTDRATDSYGPAPAACFTTARTPVANPVGTPGCGILPAHSATSYDGGLNGLQATFYPNKTLAGKPTLFSSGDRRLVRRSRHGLVRPGPRRHYHRRQLVPPRHRAGHVPRDRQLRVAHHQRRRGPGLGERHPHDRPVGAAGTHRRHQHGYRGHGGGVSTDPGGVLRSHRRRAPAPASGQPPPVAATSTASPAPNSAPTTAWSPRPPSTTPPPSPGRPRPQSPHRSPTSTPGWAKPPPPPSTPPGSG